MAKNNSYVVIRKEVLSVSKVKTKERFWDFGNENFYDTKRSKISMDY